MNELTEAALGYLARGHHLLALHGKRPNARFHGKTEEEEVGWSWEKSIYGEMTPHGDHPVDGTEGAYGGCPGCDDIKAIDAIFGHPSTTGIAILMSPFHLVADVDTEEAAALFMELAGEMPETVTAKTTKGLHIWFIGDGSEGSVWLGGRTLLFKGFGGYVAAPPSRHFADEECKVQDGVYTWLRDFDTGYDFLPPKIEEAILFTRSLKIEREPTESGRLLFVPTASEGKWTWKGWAIWPIDGLCKAIREAADGNQNNMIAWASMQARDEGVPFAIAMPQLLQAAIDGGHPKRRALTTIRGAYSRKPRG